MDSSQFDIDFSWFNHSFIVKHGFATFILIVILLAIRLLIGRYIRNANIDWTSQQRLRAIGYLKSGFFVALTLGILYIWGEAISGFAVSLFAVALAIVISVKETFMSLNGAFLRIQGHHYEIGDRICIKGIRGDVIDISLLSTTMMEIGKDSANHQITGKKIIIPNSLLLEEPIINESFLDHYDLLHVKVPMNQSDSWKKAKEILLQAAKEECASFIEQARVKIRILERSRSIDLPSIEPRVSVQVPSPGLLNIYLRVPCPVHSREKVEQAILLRFLEEFTSLGEKSEEES